MHKVNLRKQLVNLNDSPMKNGPDGDKLFANELLANVLANAKADDKPVRQLEIAMKLHKAKGVMEIEDADFDRIKSCLSKSNMSALIVGQILQLLDEKKK